MALAFNVAAIAKESKPDKQFVKLVALAPEHFRDTASIKDDSLETTAVITTLNGFQYKAGLLGIVNADAFIRAFVDKSTGKARYQIYYYVIYYGKGWNFLERVNYETPSGPATKELTVISRDVGSCSQYIGCQHIETVGFDVPEDLLRKIASTYSPAPSVESAVAWKFRFKSKSGQDFDMLLTAAEVSGALMAVDAYTASHGH